MQPLKPTISLPTITLDLAFQINDDLAPELVAAAAGFGDSQAGDTAWTELLAGWLEQLQGELPSPLQAATYCLGLSLVDDAEIAELNQQWRQIAGPTDVLAFAAQDDGPMPLPPELAGLGELELGDIVISLETAARQAPEHGHSLVEELQFLASHGLLHLLGWDHPDEASLAAMLARQERLLRAPAEGNHQR
jgi:probable rRNA maturation factor